MRRASLFCLGILLVLTRPGFAAEPPPAWAEAVTLQATGDAAGARERYERLVTEGQRSSGLFYNLGVAQWATGDPGRAALNFRRALALNPLDGDARANLDLAQHTTGALVPATDWRSRLRAIPGSYAAAVAAGCAWLGLLLLGSAWWRGSWRRGPFRWAAWLLVAAAGCGFLARSNLQPGLGAVVVTATDGRAGPGKSAGSMLKVPAGSLVTIQAESAGWCGVRLATGVQVWIDHAAVEPVKL